MLVGQVLFAIEVDLSEDILFLLQSLLFVVCALVHVALEVVLVVGLPRSRTHVTEALAAAAGRCASHEVAAGRPFDVLVAPRADLSVEAKPFSVCLFLLNDVFPLAGLEAIAGPMHLLPTLKAETGTAAALNLLECSLLRADALVAVSTGTELHFAVGLYELFAEELIVEGKFAGRTFQQLFDE